MAGGDLRYAREDLQQVGSGLADLAGELEGDGRLADVSVSQVASPRVVEALENFADDWDDKRAALATNLRGIADMATQAAEQFGEADAELARAVRDAVEVRTTSSGTSTGTSTGTRP